MKLKDKNMIESIAKEVYYELGAGFSEEVYQTAMEIELQLRKISYERQAVVSLLYKDYFIGFERLDLIVNKSFIVELKTSAKLCDLNMKQLKTYIKSTGIEDGVLINFPKSKNVEDDIDPQIWYTENGIVTKDEDEDIEIEEEKEIEIGR